MGEESMSNKIVAETEWIAARKELLAKEKELSRQREEVTRLRQQLPWHEVREDYEFETSNGKPRLSGLFGRHSQLIIYHFMFDPDWSEGCKACSMLGDHYDPLVVHLAARDVSLFTVSTAPVATLDAYKMRMGWRFPWASSGNSQFNQDYGITFTQDQLDADDAVYNYQSGAAKMKEMPGVSCFAKDDTGKVFHTYSAYSRGLENLLGVYNFLDLVAKGRDESELPYTMHWVRHHDRYDDDSFVDPYVEILGKQ